MKDHHGSARDLRPLIDSDKLIGALDHWEAICPPGGVPLRATFDPMAIPRLLSTVILLEIHPGDRFVYRLAGQIFEDRYQMGPLVGKTPRDVLGDAVEKVLGPYRLVRDEKCLFYRDSAVDWLKREPSFHSYKALLMPLSLDGRTVGMILGAFDFLRQ